MTIDLEHFEHHYGLRHPDLAEHMWEVVDHLQVRCPVAHSDAPMALGGAGSGMWVLTKYEDVFKVLQDWNTFSSDYRRLAQAQTLDSRMGLQPPISVDPPVQRDFRRLLNPFLSPQAVAVHEPQVRTIVTELIDDFVDDGRCDLVSQLAMLHPPRMLYRVVFGISDPAELERTLEHTKRLTEAKDAQSHDAAMRDWVVWIDEFVEGRRSGPRRDDIIDALLHGTVEDRSLTDDEISGAIRLLILGGFFTTNDAISSTMVLLIERPELQDELRADPRLLPQLFEETLRLEPPVISLYRVCTRDVELRGQQLKAGEAVLMHFGGANRDPEVFSEPTQLVMARPRNHHLTFGGGPHRCIGSNVARLNLRVVFEEILSRMHDIRFTEGETPLRSPASLGWGWDYLPLSFTKASPSPG